MAYNPTTGKWEDENASVTSGVQKITSQNSPLMQQAATQGRRYSNRRGLLNSTMGAQAGQEAVIKAATPIAAQDAAQTHTRNLSAQNFGQTRELEQGRFGHEAEQQQSEQTHRTGLLTAELGQKTEVAAAQREHEAGLQTAELGQKTAESGFQREHEASLQASQLEREAAEQASKQAHEASQLGQSLTSEETQTGAKLASAEYQTQVGAEAQVNAADISAAGGVAKSLVAAVGSRAFASTYIPNITAAFSTGNAAIPAAVTWT